MEVKMIEDKNASEFVSIPYTKNNKALLTGLLCISAKREGAWVDIDAVVDIFYDESISVISLKSRKVLGYWTGNVRIDRRVFRALARAWTQGRIEGAGKPQYPILLWVRRDKDADTGKPCKSYGVLYPDESYKILGEKPKEYSSLRIRQ
jgi:hypothetical protein